MPFAVLALLVVIGVISISVTSGWGSMGSANLLTYTTSRGFFTVMDIFNIEGGLQETIWGVFQWIFIGYVSVVLLTRKDYAWKLLGLIFLLGPVVAIFIKILIIFSGS